MLGLGRLRAGRLRFCIFYDWTLFLPGMQTSLLRGEMSGVRWHSETAARTSGSEQNSHSLPPQGARWPCQPSSPPDAPLGSRSSGPEVQAASLRQGGEGDSAGTESLSLTLPACPSVSVLQLAHQVLAMVQAFC